MMPPDELAHPIAAPQLDLHPTAAEGAGVRHGLPASFAPKSCDARHRTPTLRSETMQWFERDTADAYKLLALILLFSIGMLILRLA